jgi:hypothetical protein
MMPIATALAVLLAASAASAQPLPVPKVGQCPSGYRESAATAPRPATGRRSAVPKTGRRQTSCRAERTAGTPGRGAEPTLRDPQPFQPPSIPFETCAPVQPQHDIRLVGQQCGLDASAQASQRQRGDVLEQLAANGEVAPPRVERDANLTLLITHGAHRHEKGDPGLLRRPGPIGRME